MFELGALLSLRRAVPHLGSQIKEAETIFQYNLCPREFAQFYVTRLDYWIVRICSPSCKWCGPEITDRKENGSWVYLPMWQGNNMVHVLFCSYFLSFFFFFSFFFSIVHPWASLWIFDICLTLRNFEELWHACGEYTAQSKSSTVETRFTCAMIKSHHSPRYCVSALNCFQSSDTNCLTSINKMCSLALAWVRYWNC